MANKREPISFSPTNPLAPADADDRRMRDGEGKAPSAGADHKSKKKQAELLGKHMIPVFWDRQAPLVSIIIIWRSRFTTKASRTFS